MTKRVNQPRATLNQLRATVYQWRDRRYNREPNRSISRYRVVRWFRTEAGYLSLKGWAYLIAAATGLGFLAMHRGLPFAGLAALVLWCAVRAGADWTVRNVVMQWSYHVECDCGKDLDGKL